MREGDALCQQAKWGIVNGHGLCGAQLLMGEIELFAANGPTQMPEMDANLIRATGQRSNFYERGSVGETVQDGEVGDGRQTMLFVNDAPGLRCFWMRNTLVPLSIAFIADDGTIVNIDEMKPQTDDSHCSVRPVRFVLEMRTGWFSGPFWVNPTMPVTRVSAMARAGRSGSANVAYTPGAR